MRLRIDHVTLAASRLETLAGAFAANGLEPVYGGMHSNGVTHMSLVVFDDGSYVELISVVRPGYTAPKWHEHMVNEGGPCAWAVRADDVVAEAGRLRSRGVTVGHVTPMERRRPDGQTVAWDLAIVGDHGAGAMHPFIISDRTPRALRVPPSEDLAGSEITGIVGVVLGVEDAGAAAELFQAAYDLPAPRRMRSTDGTLQMASFPGEPVTLVAPETGGGWLSERLEKFGPTPCAFLLGSRDLRATRERLGLGEAESWGDGQVTWLQGDPMPSRWLGVVAV